MDMIPSEHEAAHTFPSPLVPMTQAIIRQGMSDAGGWNAKQFEILGVGWPPFRGWRVWVEGRLFTKGDIERFIELKGKTKKPRKVRRKPDAGFWETVYGDSLEREYREVTR